MLSLDSPDWSELSHAYGNASDIPELLRQLQHLPSSVNDQEPWFSIWSSLAHQGDVYSASFAAVPYVVASLATAPTKADFSFFQFPAWVEVCRKKRGVPIPAKLAVAYHELWQSYRRLLRPQPSVMIGMKTFCPARSVLSQRQRASFQWLKRSSRSIPKPQRTS
jgi:hypothetical protein